MESNKSQNLMEEAYRLLNRANEELTRPSEDVVSFAVCAMAQDSMRKMLSAFLTENNVDFDSNESLEKLQLFCVKIQPKLKDFSLKAVNCRDSVKEKEEHYCLSINQVCSCVECANNLKDIIQNQ